MDNKEPTRQIANVATNKPIGITDKNISRGPINFWEEQKATVAQTSAIWLKTKESGTEA